MDNYSHLIKDFQIFRNEIHGLVSEANDLIRRLVETEEELLSFTKAKDEWQDRVQDVLKSSFANPDNDFVTEFYNTYAEPSFHLTEIGGKRPVSIRIKDLKATIQSKVDYLIHNLRIIAVCDHISKGDKFDVSERSKYTTQEKLELLLEKLYHLNDDSYYPIEMLLEGNGIKLRNSSESRELAEILKSNGYVEQLGGLGIGILVRITASGSMYVEQQGISYSENYEDIPSDQNEIDSRIDEIIEKLTTLGLGQEILFEELQELKELYAKLNKKNWGQIIKGKLVDLALGKIVENDTIKFIYEKLTGHELKLLN
jgi:hypothetical protein